jgi:hypothetical protein
MTKILRPLGSIAAALVLAGCGSTTVTVELTDAPPQTDSLEHVYVSLERVEVHVAGSDEDEDKSNTGKPETDGSAADDGGWRTVTPHAGTFDLLALRNDVRAELGKLELPSGKITQIRLFIDPAARNEVVLTSGGTCALDLGMVPPTGVKIIHPFKALDVEDSSKLNLVVDFKLDESIDQTGTCSFALKPVIELKHAEKG